MDDLVGVGAVVGIEGHADRDGGADRLAGRLHLEALLGDGAPDALGDVERLLRPRIRQEDGELLPAEARRDVRVAQVAVEDVCDALQHRVARQVPVGVVDVPEQVEVGHDHRQRRARPLRATELLPQRTGEMAGVEEAGLGIDARLLLEGRDAERAVDQEQWRHGGREQERVPVPQPRERNAQHREHEIRREALHREEARAAQRVPAREMQHRGEQEVVGADEDDRGHEAGECELELRPEAGVAHELDRPPRREPVERVVGDVEALDVPGVANLQPLGDPVDDPEQRDQLGRQEQDAGDQEDQGRVVALVARRDHDEELRHRGRSGEGEEGEPAVGARREVRERHHRGGDGQDPHRVEIRLRARGQGLALAVLGRRSLHGRSTRDSAHRTETGSNLAVRAITHAEARCGRRAMVET